MNKIQPSFSSGELSQSLHSRIDIDKYQTGLKTCRNFLINLSGGVSRRTGTKYVATTKTEGDSVRLLPFEASSEDTYVLEFGDYYCRFYKDNGQIITTLDDVDAWETGTVYVVGNFIKEDSEIYYCITDHTSGTFAIDLAAEKWLLQSIYELPTIYKESEVKDLKFIQSADTMFLAHPDHPIYEISRYGDVDWTFSIYDYDVPPFMLSNQVTTHTMQVSAVTGTGINLTSTDDYFDAEQIGSYFKIYHDIDGQSVKSTFGATGQSTTIQCKGAWRIKSFGTTCNLDVSVEKSIDNGSNWTTVRSFTMLNTEIDTYGNIDDFCLIRLNCTSWTVGNTMVLTTDPFNQPGIIKLTAVTTTKAAVGTVIQLFASTGTSDDWAESSWSTYRGFPSALTFFQDRLCFASTYAEPQTIWASKTGDYYNFDVSDPLVDSDRISIQLASKKLNGINNLVFLNNIIALTSSGEWRVGAADSGAITPTNVSASVQGNRGSSSLSPVQIGNKVIYLQPSSSILRDLGYNYDSNSFTGDNISVLSSHLFKGYTIVDIDYQEEPNSIIYLIRSDGKLLTCTYMKEQEIIGFSWHDTQGTFENIAIITHENKKQVWVCVKRGDSRFIEVLQDEEEDVVDQWYLDSALGYDSTATDTFAGLEHLEGIEVNALADGNVVKGLTVTSGEVTLPYEAERVIVGLRYISDFESLPITLQSDEGTTKDKKIRIPELAMVFENTRGGYVGDPDVGTITDDSHVNTLNESINTRTHMDLGISLFSGQVKFNLNSSHGKDRKIFYRQYDPLPVNILAIITKIVVGG